MVQKLLGTTLARISKVKYDPHKSHSSVVPSVTGL